MTKPLPGVDCILKIDAARYDETPMLVKSRGQSSCGQMSGASASVAQPAAGEEGLRGMALPLADREHVVLPEPVRRRSCCYLQLRGKDLAIGVSIGDTLES